jgi:hypothetical protein
MHQVAYQQFPITPDHLRILRFDNEFVRSWRAAKKRFEIVKDVIESNMTGWPKPE